MEPLNPPEAERTGPVRLTIAEAAARVGGRAEGRTDVPVRDVAPLEEAGPEELGFLAHRRYLPGLAASRAAGVLVPESLAAAAGEAPARIVVPDAYLALARLLDLFHPRTPPPPTVHPTAVLGRGVELGDGVTVGPYAVLGDRVTVGAGSRIGPHVCVGDGCRLGTGVVLHPHVTLYPGVVLGDRVEVHAGCRLGVDGFGYVFHEGEHVKIPQVGSCLVGDDVEIGANTCIDRGSIGGTQVGAGTKIDNLVHLGHNVTVGERALLVAQVGVAGSSTIGAGAALGGQAGISGHLTVGAGARVGAQAGVIGDIPAGATVSGYPARPHGEAMRALGWLFRLPELGRRVRALERAVFGRRETEAREEGGR